MLVLYLKENKQFLQAIKGFLIVEEREGKLYWGEKVIVNDLIRVGYKYCHEKQIEPKYEWNEEMEIIEEIPQTLEELNLIELSQEELEKYLHPRNLEIEIDDLKKDIAENKSEIEKLKE